MYSRLFLFWFFVFAKVYAETGFWPPFCLSYDQCVLLSANTTRLNRSRSPVCPPQDQCELSSTNTTHFDRPCSGLKQPDLSCDSMLSASSQPGTSETTRVRFKYTRTELLAVPSTPHLAPEVTARLRSLQIGVCLPRKRYGRRVRKAPDSQPLKVLSLNCQSCREVSSDLFDLFIDKHIDLAFLCETWLRDEGDEAIITNLTQGNYDLYSFPRLKTTNRSGGSIGIIVKKALSKHVNCKRLTYTSFECVEVKLTIDRVSAVCLVIYRRHPNKKNNIPRDLFFTEFPDLLSQYASNNIDFSIHGDFNFHYDDPSSSDMLKMKTILSDFDLCQLVDKPTQRLGHILDWVLVRNDGSLLKFKTVREYPGLSDHYVIFSDLCMRQPTTAHRWVSSRSVRGICRDDFRADIQALVEDTRGDGCVSSLAEAYDGGLRKILDSRAPVVARRVRDRLPAPFMDEEVRERRRVRRRAERKWRKTGLTVFKEIYLKENRNYQKFVREKSIKYYSDEMNSCRTSKQIFSVADGLLGRKASSPLPTNIPIHELPQTFCDFFTDKIKVIRNDLDSRSTPPPTFGVYNGPKLCEFQLVTQKQIIELIGAMPSKSCCLDPIPTTLTKEFVNDLVPLITNIINCSLSSGVVPYHFKQAIVIPLLKKKGLDCNILKNYRPVSNLPFISKILERVVLRQLQDHLSKNNLIEMYQSAYRSGHSVETAVLSVTDSLLQQSDNHRVSAVGLLDLSAAFDTLDHAVLLKRLETSFGIRGNALAWFTSYVTDRVQSVMIDGAKSEAAPLVFGVPQGSVLGPVLFTLYSQPLSDVISTHNLQFHKYADDTEISSHSKPKTFSMAVSSLAICTEDVLEWMNSNKLKLNTDKTEVMTVGIPSCLSRVAERSMLLDGSNIVFQDSVKYLGVRLDQTLSMKDHISSVCCACFLELRRISTIKKFFSRDALVKLVSATVLSRLDFCNSTLIGITEAQLGRLQRVQNAAARLVLNRRKHDHATPMLKELHWLPVRARCQYKIATLAYRHFDGTLAPSLSACLTIHNPVRNLRSSNNKLLVVPIFNLRSAGKRSFRVVAPTTWNALPHDVRHAQTLTEFKSKLKTHLFQQFLE